MILSNSRMPKECSFKVSQKHMVLHIKENLLTHDIKHKHIYTQKEMFITAIMSMQLKTFVFGIIVNE